MSKLSTRLAPGIIGALLLAAPITASADPTSKTIEFYFDTDAPVTIYLQPNKKHPAPTFLICTGNGVYSVDLIGLETIPAYSCIYVSNHKISARVTPGSLEEVSMTDKATQRATSWIDDRIAELESKSEPTENDVKMLKSFKLRQAQTNALLNRTQEPPHVFVTLVR